MKIIGITQREDFIESYDEIRDGLDRKLPELIINCGFLPIVIPTIKLDYVEKVLSKIKFDGIILSGGNSIHNFGKRNEYISKIRDEFELNLIKESIKRNIKVFGICRGMQILNLFFKGNLSLVEGHVNVKHSLKSLDKKFTFPKKVNSYHNFSISQKDLPLTIEPLAIDKDKNIESFKYKDNVLAVMWHPEREIPFKENDINLIHSFFNG